MMNSRRAGGRGPFRGFRTIHRGPRRLDRLLSQPLTAWRRVDWWDSPLDQVLVHATRLIEAS